MWGTTFSSITVQTLGSLMSTEKGAKDWLVVMGSEIWDIEVVEQRIFAVLKLSCNHLPPHLKQCFAFCSIFPKDYHMEKDMLIQLWVANGFVGVNPLLSKFGHIFDR